MSSSTEAQRLIALSLGKIAMSRQQRGGINLHKNLLVASVLHKARTTYMMDNFQTLLANKRAQAEREAAAKMIVETPSEKLEEKTMDTSCQSRGVTDCNKANDTEVPHGERPEKNNYEVFDKENIVPVKESRVDNVENALCDKSDATDKKSSPRDISNNTPVVIGKLPLSRHNGNTNYVSQLSSCRCTGGKRRRSFVDCDSVTEPKKPRFEDDYENSDSDDSEYESDSGDNYEKMQTTESSQVKSLVDIFSTGFNGLCKDNDTKQQQSTGHINVYVSADRSLSGHQYVLKDISCGTQIKDNVALHTAIALAV
ncbi:immediate early response gene 5-like protein [Mercenaria mercenaria]|uniref:immediate early response gene 5-like protein n=1 Tax=Mercenaria mercenaria TaxID=6596 RepID=UPI001E1E022C|nr:immediate early response gene 5-like protein [Mercenaria mercenaria]